MLRNCAMKAALGLSFTALLVAPVLAQEGMNGVFVTPVANAPFSAVVILQSTKPLPDGTTQRFKSINNIARDSHGRIYNERRQLMPLSFTGTPALLSGHIFDPETRINIFLNPFQHIARQTILKGPAPNWDEIPAPPAKVPVAAKTGENGPRVEDLGTQVLDNVTVHGQRFTSTIPAAVSGADKPLVVTHEYWYSEELHLNMLIKHNDPRIGEQTFTVKQVKRDDPDPQMFKVPSDYKVVDETPPEN
ncbi:MAG TPA: hypothetical protein VG649_16365 [Candidatus Angelobacter sp.]|nr:hypothetical protein [Candidatus Angelobacter sp.]